MAGGEMGNEDGGIDLNLRTPEPIRSAIRPASPPVLAGGGLSEKEDMKEKEVEVFEGVSMEVEEVI